MEHNAVINEAKKLYENQQKVLSKNIELLKKDNTIDSEQKDVVISLVKEMERAVEDDDIDALETVRMKAQKYFS